MITSETERPPRRSSSSGSTARSGRPVTTTISRARVIAADGERRARSTRAPSTGSTVASASSASSQSCPAARIRTSSVSGRRSDEDDPPVPQHVRQGQGSRRADGRVEARLPGRPGDAVGILVEDDRQIVPRSVVELLHHQPAAPGGARPVHGPQRLARRVVADGVDLEAGRAPEPRARRSGITSAVGREDRRQRRDPRPDQHARRLVDLLLDPREAERIGQRDVEWLEPMASAREASRRR